MITIDIDNIIPYSLEKKLIDSENIVEGNLFVIDASRRNRMIKVVRKGKISYLIKQPRVTDYQSKSALIREAHIYNLLHKDSSLCQIKDIIPRYYGFDEQNNISVIEFILDSEPLNHFIYKHNEEKYQKSVGEKLGKMLSLYHSIFKNVKNHHKLSFLPKKIPSFVFFITRPSPDIFSTLSQGNLQLLKIVQETQELNTFFEDLYSEWQTETLIHGDIKADNILINYSNNDIYKFKIVDWEFADMGDRAWDIGSIFHDFVRMWLFSLPIIVYQSVTKLRYLNAKYPLDNAQLSISSFWNTYAQSIPNCEAKDLLVRSARYCAARLIQTAFESLYQSHAVSNTAIFLLQTSANMLRNTIGAIRDLLGIHTII